MLKQLLSLSFFIKYVFGDEEIHSVNMCLNIFNDSHRDAIVDEHNNLRSKLIHGHLSIKGGEKAPKAKNMYKLYYNCDLERSAQAWANECIWDHSDFEVGENLFMVGAENFSKFKTIFMATEDWWKELEFVGGGISSNNTLYSRALTQLRIGHWSQMAWAKTTFIGCGYKSCVDLNERTIFVCHYFPQGNVINRPIYDIGTPCQSDADCETYQFSKCENATGLCDNFALREIIPEPHFFVPKEPSDAEEIELNEIKNDVLENLSQNLTIMTFEKSKFIETWEDLPSFVNSNLALNFYLLLLFLAIFIVL